jgi:hypothetical protein
MEFINTLEILNCFPLGRNANALISLKSLFLMVVEHHEVKDHGQGLCYRPKHNWPRKKS